MLEPQQKILLQHLVGKAVYEILFPVARLFPTALIEHLAADMAAELHRLGSPPSTYLLRSLDGTWDLELRPSGLSFRIYDYQIQDGFGQFLHLIGLLEPEDHERVALRYSSAAPIERDKIGNLLADRVVDLLSDPGKGFTQEVSGTWDLGHYRLRYGIQPLQDETFYLSHAFVSAENVADRDLENVLCELEEEGLRLLSWPITSWDFLELDPEISQLAADPMDLSFPESSLFEEVNRERIELLARKHTAEDLSSEDEKHLEVLTERVRRLVPQVTEQDWQAVEDISARLGDIEDRTRRIRTKYSLNG